MRGLPAARALFFRSLATMLAAGVSLPRALDVLARQMQEGPLHRALPAYGTQLAHGKPLSRVLSQPPGLFSPLQLQLIAVGESTGAMVLVLERLAENSEKANRTWNRIGSALTYPVLVLVASLVLILWAQNAIFKNLLDFLTTMGGELPLATRLLSFSARLLSNPWFLLLLVAGLGGAGWGLRRLAENRAMVRRAWALALRLPAMGNLLRTALAVDFCRSLALCVSAGVPLLRALDLAGGAAPWAVGLSRARERIAAGELVHQALSEVELLPPMTLHLMAAGESTGKLSFLLERAARLCEESLDSALESAVAALQPAVLMLVGILVGFVVYATLVPLTRLVETL